MKTLIVSPEFMVASCNVIDEYLSEFLEQNPPLLNRWRIKGGLEKIEYYLKTFGIEYTIE